MPSAGDSMTETLLGYDIHCGDREELLREFHAALEDKASPARYTSCLNPHSWVLAKDSPEFALALRTASWLVPDGVGIVIASRILKGRIRKRITGFEIGRAHV